VEELGFTAFALEASLPYASRLNNYILSGEGDLEDIMANMPGWFLWDTKELFLLFEWLKEHNVNTTNKVAFYGFDIVAPNDAMEQIFDYLSQVDPAYYEMIKRDDFARELINDNFWPASSQQYSGISEERKSIINKNYEGLFQALCAKKIEYIRLSSEELYDWIVSLAYSARAAHRMFSTDDRIQAGLIRDSAMAYISSWIQKTNGKTIIWAHNVHISKAAFKMSMFPDVKINGMGSILHNEFQDKMISIGASFGSGEFKEEGRIFEPPDANSIDGVFSGVSLKYFLFDMTKEQTNKELTNWLIEENVLCGQEFEMSCVPIASFDAFFYTDYISKVQYNPQTHNKRNN
jgi:erythromycin esterase